MIAVGLRFPAGRYHSTPWGRHPNEGAAEWPPSPWRVLRSLVAVWQLKASELPAEIVGAVLAKLAQPPEYFLPPATPGHTRHYVPWEKKGPTDRTLILDSFLAMDPTATTAIIWRDVSLIPEERGTLTALLDRLTYLGRAESWCQARLLDTPPIANCRQVEAGIEGRHELVRVLAPTLPLKCKSLIAETSELRKQGRIDPPDSRWLLYARSADALLPYGPTRAIREVLPTAGATAARFAIAGPVRPRVQEGVAVAELARRAALAWYGRGHGGGRSAWLAGKDERGVPLSGHQHAHYLPTDENQDGFLDHLTIWAPGGLGREEVEAVAQIDALDRGDGAVPLPLAFLGHGSIDDVRGGNDDLLFGESRAWVSSTPFVCPRHVKWRGPREARREMDGPEAQLRLEVARRGGLQGWPDLVGIEPVAGTEYGSKVVPWHEFRRWRDGERPAGPTAGFRLRFDGPVQGPVALGYGSHFGLGLFRPEGGRGP